MEFSSWTGTFSLLQISTRFDYLTNSPRVLRVKSIYHMKITLHSSFDFAVFFDFEEFQELLMHDISEL